jgi:hypothetical protein
MSKALWISVSYRPVSLFSLKRSDATSMAARSNLVPTPYAIKMALLKQILENEGYYHQQDFKTWIKPRFNWIRDLIIYIQPPERSIVNRNGYKLRYYDQTADKADKTRKTLPLQAGYVFREWVYSTGDLSLCCGKSDRAEELRDLLAQINYFGKRGGFFQYLPDATRIIDEPVFLPDPLGGFTVQPMDDLGKQTTFEKIDPFSGQTAKIGKDRIIETGLLPLRLLATGANYDYYERI